MPLVVFAIALALFARQGVAYAAALLYAVFPPIAWLSTIPHLDVWAVDFTLVITLLLLRARAAGRPNRTLVAGGRGYRASLLLQAGSGAHRAVYGAWRWSAARNGAGP